MPPKRKSDHIDDTENASDVAKRARTGDEDAAVASSSKTKTSKATKPQYASWKDVELDGEDEDEVPIYDDCNTIRRKIRTLLKTPGFKVGLSLSAPPFAIGYNCNSRAFSYRSLIG
ncbi:hypothetical protein M407DRAFT_32974 [Tulasnella calospora MUT 4182]|uniref:Uncharacterized protein n=1 Tax=Tulasnella calospora MUT 4182 TaxID=1051891 RepID=A0A0C3K7L4_9AGAM|nr:hypothetical protein M407DRAFT_32974 [Tulasnella calospora MUT 4182]